MRKFAFYLPQFHEIKENNEWWGEGFTEWTNVKKAVPLYKGHYQPSYPLNGNFYNLLDKSTVEWQTKLAKDYHVDGFIYYHYYFCGKMLLEKPAENLLEWTDIDQPFFFCWANHDWNRSWNGSKEVLMKQEYGDETEWEKHFEYLRPFFEDKRYEKKDNKPVFMIFSSNIPEKSRMFDYFNERCKEVGFEGIYLIETFSGTMEKEKGLDGFWQNKCAQTEKILIREFATSLDIYYQTVRSYPYRLYKKIYNKLNSSKGKTVIERINGENLYKVIMKEPMNEYLIHSIFFEWDNTPRHGTRGSVVSPPKKKTFNKLMDHFAHEDYLFINAWNEWAEGMTLEPTEKNGYKYLEWIKEWSEKNA